MQFEITYGAVESKGRGWLPFVYINGASKYLNVANAKTYRGALSKAKRIAENQAELHQRMSRTNVVTLKAA
jgi:hypothetical protein